MNVFPAVKSIQNSTKAFIRAGQLLGSLKTTNRSPPPYRPLPIKGLGADLFTRRQQSKASHFVCLVHLLPLASDFSCGMTGGNFQLGLGFNDRKLTSLKKHCYHHTFRGHPFPELSACPSRQACVGQGRGPIRLKACSARPHRHQGEN